MSKRKRESLSPRVSALIEKHRRSLKKHAKLLHKKCHSESRNQYRWIIRHVVLSFLVPSVPYYLAGYERISKCSDRLFWNFITGQAPFLCRNVRVRFRFLNRTTHVLSNSQFSIQIFFQFSIQIFFRSFGACQWGIHISRHFQGQVLFKNCDSFCGLCRWLAREFVW
jgi:hypothetical protein